MMKGRKRKEEREGELSGEVEDVKLCRCYQLLEVGKKWNQKSIRTHASRRKVNDGQGLKELRMERERERKVRKE